MKKNKNLKSIPKFKNENEERNFWANHDTTEYFDTENPIKIDLSELKPSTQPVLVRFPLVLLNDLKILANSRDVPYQSLMKIFLAERVEEELRKKNYSSGRA